MKHVVSFSGGRTSGYLVYLMEQKRKNENLDVEYIFMDTGAEHPKTYEFIRNISKYFGVNITCLRVNINPKLGKGNSYKVVPIEDICQDLQPWKDMIKKYGVPYYGGAFCTDRMKLGPFTKYCNEKFGKHNYKVWLGIRYDEPKRLFGNTLHNKLIKAGVSKDEISDLYLHHLSEISSQEKTDFYDGMFSSEIVDYKYREMCADIDNKIESYKNIRHLAEISDFSKEDVLIWWKKQEFDLGIDEWNGNCVFCIKKSDLKLAAAQRDNPEHYFTFLEMLDSEDVRTGEKAGSKDSMYRNKTSLQQVISMFDGSTGEEIKSRIRGAKMTDSGSCSESCEVFNHLID